MAKRQHRSQTKKGESFYEDLMEEYCKKVDRQRNLLNDIMKRIGKPVTIDELKELQKRLLTAKGGYTMLVEEFMDFLERQCTDKSEEKLSEVLSAHRTFENILHSFDLTLDLKISTISDTENLIEKTAVKHVGTSFGDSGVAMQELSKYLLRKDLMLNQLMKFDDKPENYHIWKTSFLSVVKEIGADEREELDLLVYRLGKDSVRHAMNIRASSTSDPKASLIRLWERLDERYGAPEMLDAALRKKLEDFPKLMPKDTQLLYELADLVEQISSHMSNPIYKDLLAYYNTSIGIVPVVNKLPNYLQERWTLKAFDYKRKQGVLYPPFSFLASFIRETSVLKNDPGFVYENPKSQNKPIGTMSNNRSAVSTMKTEVQPESGSNTPPQLCFFHNAQGHTLNECRTYKNKPIAVRKKLLRDKNICYSCCSSTTHRAAECPTKAVCSTCGGNHATALHVHGGEQHRTKPEEQPKNTEVKSRCTKVCGTDAVSSKSCAKVVLVSVHVKSKPENKRKMYALIDDQSNRTLAHPDFFEYFNDEHYEPVKYSLSSCAGTTEFSGRKTRVDQFVVSSVSSMLKLPAPAITECEEIPDLRDEIPSPKAARAHDHLREIADFIPDVDPSIPVLLLLGRDIPEAHHVLDQRIGGRGQPFAQQLPLGWVLVGEVCLGKVHQPDNVTTMKTHINSSGRHSLFPPCGNKFHLKERYAGDDVFQQTPDDNKVSFSVEDRIFMDMMSDQFVKGENGHWSAPLPFRQNRPKLPNNRDYVLKRSLSLRRSLQKDTHKLRQFTEFMDTMLANGHAEIAPPLQQHEECWYLPIFGIYHPKKKDQIRVVFDSSAIFSDVSLNKVLMTGPDLTNNLLGILMRFQREPVAVLCDVRQMFYQFYVHEEDRNYLRFFWYQDSDINKPLMEYRMCVHVFGNSPSPAIATYGLRKCVDNDVVADDVKEFIKQDFYVDDGVASFPSTSAAVDVVKRTQKALEDGGQVKLHKIASNEKTVLEAFPREDLAKDLKDCIIEDKNLPTQRSLGLVWCLETDSFTFKMSNVKKPLTRRGLLSTVNSLYDPLGLIAPVVLQGKLLLRDLVEETVDWDKPLDYLIGKEWCEWTEALNGIEKFSVPRICMSQGDDGDKQEIIVFSDASEKAIAAVSYLRNTDNEGTTDVRFVLGKSKVAPKTGHTIPRLELCAAVLAVEVGELIASHLGYKIENMTFYTDSRVVLGYLNNRTRRFYVYVQNRVSRILNSTDRKQWVYVSTTDNPADDGTRPVAMKDLQSSKWVKGEEFLKRQTVESPDDYEMVLPDEDKEVRPITKLVMLLECENELDYSYLT